MTNLASTSDAFSSRVPMERGTVALDASRYRATIFDLDGVLVETKRLHRRAWKRVFDELLDAWRNAERGSFEPFDERSDYDTLVDGKPRLDGVRSFLESRDLSLDPGGAGDRVDDLTVRGIGERKNEIYHEEILIHGVRVFDDVLPCFKKLRRAGCGIAVVTSSRNRERIVESAGLGDWFDAAVDGVTLDERELAGKPAGDLFVEAARRLGVEPERAAAFEDAIAGVEAAANAGCGMVVGVDRDNRASTARRFEESGATEVIKSLAELGIRSTDLDRKEGSA